MATMLLTGCATNGPVTSYCTIAQPIYVSEGDTFTPETARDILRHNETWSKLCQRKA